MRVHLTGESQGAVRVAPCKNVPAACKDFYLAEQEREAAMSREREAARSKIYNEAAQLSRIETERKRNTPLGIGTSIATERWIAPLKHTVK